jgi:hypothetical protein
MLFKHRYLIDKQKQRLEKIEPKLSRIAERLQKNGEQATPSQADKSEVVA